MVGETTSPTAGATLAGLVAGLLVGFLAGLLGGWLWLVVLKAVWLACRHDGWLSGRLAGYLAGWVFCLCSKRFVFGTGLGDNSVPWRLRLKETNPPTLRSRDIGVSKLVFHSFFPHFLSLDVFPSYSSLPFFLFSSSCYGVGPGGVWDIPPPPPGLPREYS